MSLLKPLQSAVRKATTGVMDWRGGVGEATLTDTNWWRNILSFDTYTGRRVSDESMMQATAVYSAMRLITETLGCLPMHMYRRTEHGRERVYDHPLARKLSLRPSQYETISTFQEGLALSQCLWNQGYVLVDRLSTGTVISLKVIPQPCVTPRRISNGRELVYDVTQNGRQQTYKFGEIIPVKGFGHVAELEGMKVSGLHRNAFALALSAEEYAARFFSGDARPSGAFVLDKQLTPDQREQLRDELQRRYTGTEKAHKFMILEAGMKFVSISASNRDSQFLEARKFQVAEVARVFRVPLHMLYEMERATYANAEQDRQNFKDFTLVPYANRIEKAYNAFLLAPDEQDEYYLEFSFQALLRGDSAQRGNFYSQLVNCGAITPAEIRQRENLPYIEGTDELNRPANMLPVSEPVKDKTEDKK